jgi:hypothetical protein
VHFDPDVWEALEKHMKQSRINNVSIAVNDAVKFSLAPEHQNDRDAALVKLFHQLSFSLAEHRKKTARDMTCLQEMFFQFVLTYLTHTHKINDVDLIAAEAQGNVRMDKFMEKFVRSLQQKKDVIPEDKS